MSAAAFWNDRYRAEAYAYGTAPNTFLEKELPRISPGDILFPAEGEGRNAVFAATLGWNVSAFDISSEGKRKALRLAEQQSVRLDYHVGELAALPFAEASFDVIALIYAHFPADSRLSIHHALEKLLRPGGIVLLEAFSKNHLSYQARFPTVGGPRDVASLLSVDDVKAEFPNCEPLRLMETEVTLHEGLFHRGTGSVIRFFGRKK